MSDLEFRIKMHEFFISKNSIVLDCNINANINSYLVELVEKKIKKHPLIWKLFFMV